MFILGNLLIGAVHVLQAVFFAYTIIVIASVVISWVNADPYNTIVQIIQRLTEPVYRKIRRKMPTTAGGIDLTPLIVLLILMFLEQGILPSVMEIGYRLK